MFDFTWSEHTLGNVFYCLITYGLFIAVFYKRYVTNALFQSAKTNRWLMFCAFVLIVTACIDSDWFSYREMVYNYDFTSGAINHGEPIYKYIIRAVGQNYLLFRIIVWGGALGLACIAFKRFEININLAVFFLIAVFLVKFNYGRATLGMASFSVGLSYLIKPKKGHHILSILCAILFFWAAYEFHHSMLLLVLISPIVVYLPMDKPIILIVTLFSLPLVASLLNANLFLVDQLENEYVSEKFYRYIEKEGGRANLFGIIQGIISYGVFVLPIVFDSIVLVKNHRVVAPSIIKLYRVVISTLIIAVSFLIIGLSSNAMFYRILFMSFIPLIILTVHLFEQLLMNRKIYKVMVWWGITGIAQITLYLLYKNL